MEYLERMTGSLTEAAWESGLLTEVLEEAGPQEASPEQAVEAPVEASAETDYL